MKEMANMKWWQWLLFIVVGGTVFYLVYPKYYFVKSGDGGIITKCNRITGQMKTFTIRELIRERR